MDCGKELKSIPAMPDFALLRLQGGSGTILRGGKSRKLTGPEDVKTVN